MICEKCGSKIDAKVSASENLYTYRDDDWYKTGIDALVDFGAEMHQRGLQHVAINTVFGVYTNHPRDTLDYRAMWFAYLKKETFTPEQRRAMAEMIREIGK